MCAEFISYILRVTRNATCTLGRFVVWAAAPAPVSPPPCSVFHTSKQYVCTSSASQAPTYGTCSRLCLPAANAHVSMTRRRKTMSRLTFKRAPITAVLGQPGHAMIGISDEYYKLLVLVNVPI